MLIYGLIGAAGLVLLAWLWRGDRDPLIYLVPASLAFPPILAYAGKALAWPTGHASTRVALAGCILLFGLFRLVRGEFGYLPIRGIRFLAPYLGLVALSVLWSVVGRYNGDVGAIANEFLSWLLPVAVFLLLAGSRRSNNDSGRAARVLLMTTLGIALFSFLQALALLGYEGAVPSAIADLTRFGQDDLWWGSFRLYGTLPNLGPNVMGDMLGPHSSHQAGCESGVGGRGPCRCGGHPRHVLPRCHACSIDRCACNPGLVSEWTGYSLGRTLCVCGSCRPG